MLTETETTLLDKQRRRCKVPLLGDPACYSTAYHTQDNFTIALIFTRCDQGGMFIRLGVAKRSPLDAPDQERAKAIAFSRALRSGVFSTLRLGFLAGALSMIPSVMS